MTDFYLTSPRAKALYETYAADLPLVDFHNHLSVKDLTENRRFTDPGDLWIAPDPYKHRAMRMAGVPEQNITGGASPEEKFAAWCSIFPDLVGNPLYGWSLMELREVFGIDLVPRRENASGIYAGMQAFLKENDVTPAWFLQRFKVEKLCPCLSFWEELPAWAPDGVVVPSLRADDAFLPPRELVAGMKLNGFLTLLEERVAAFAKAGCRFADHALDTGFAYYGDDGKNKERFAVLSRGEALCAEDKARFASFVLTVLLDLYARHGLVVQFHLGALRRTSTRLRVLAGPAGGYASAGNPFDVTALTELLNTVEQTGTLPRVILFPLDPADTARLAMLSGSFSKDGARGLVTPGPAWWWNDHRYGIEQTLEVVAANSLLATFIGMTTDSRSFLSLLRHDVFRRILCSWLARQEAENALLAPEEDVARLIRKICYENAKGAFSE